MIFLVVALATLAVPDAPVHPPAEVDIAARFETAVPDLFSQWVAGRPDALKAAALGDPVPGTLSTVVLFIECTDATPPKLLSFDVRRTDSIPSPYVGVIRAGTNESCERKSALCWYENKRKHEALVTACIGKPYEECIAAGGLPMPEHPNLPFSYTRDITISYRWSKGAWEFEREEAREPKQYPGNKT